MHELEKDSVNDDFIRIRDSDNSKVVKTVARKPREPKLPPELSHFSSKGSQLSAEEQSAQILEVIKTQNDTLSKELKRY